MVYIDKQSVEKKQRVVKIQQEVGPVIIPVSKHVSRSK